jgi:uncharacterized cupredoxin-like copper-binding protein
MERTVRLRLSWYSTRRQLLRDSLALAGLGLLSGCRLLAAVQPSGPQEVTVEGSEFRFTPANVTVKANQPVQVTLRNTGSLVHDWTVQGLGQPVHVQAQPGQTASAQFTFTRAGTFRIVCVELGHEPAGMVGQLIVQP